MIFDTGTFVSIINESAVRQLNLQSKPLSRPLIVGSRQLLSYVVVPHLKIGNLMLTNIDMAVMPTPLGRIDPPFAENTTIGRLGLTELKGIDVELDLGHDKINLFASERCPGGPVYWAASYAVAPMRRGRLRDLYFVMELDGKKLQTSVNTASSFAVISTTASKKLYGFDETSPDLLTDPFGGGASPHYRAMALTASGLRVTGADVALEKPTNCETTLLKDRDGAYGFDNCYGAYPLRLGISVLKALRLYIASSENKLYFTSLSPDDPAYFYQQAMEHWNAKQLAPAIADLDQALKLNATFVDALYARVRLHLANKDAAAARADLDALDQSVPKDSNLRRQLAFEYIHAAAPAQAVAQLGLWIESHPQDDALPVVLDSRCWTRMLWGRELDKAEADCTEALRLRPKSPSFLGSRGWLYFRQGQFDEALKDFNEALSEQPRLASALYGRGMIESGRGQENAAQIDISAAFLSKSDVADELTEYKVVP